MITDYTDFTDDEDGYEYNRVEEDDGWMSTTTLDDHPYPWMEEE